MRGRMAHGNKLHAREQPPSRDFRANGATDERFVAAGILCHTILPECQSHQHLFENAFLCVRPVAKRAARALTERLPVQALAAVDARVQLLETFDRERKDLCDFLARAGQSTAFVALDLRVACLIARLRVIHAAVLLGVVEGCRVYCQIGSCIQRAFLRFPIRHGILTAHKPRVILLHVRRAEPKVHVVHAIALPVLLALLAHVVHDEVLLVVRDVQESAVLDRCGRGRKRDGVVVGTGAVLVGLGAGRAVVGKAVERHFFERDHSAGINGAALLY